MTERQQILLEAAKAEYGTVYPCGTRESWEDCFTEYKGDLMVWFDFGDILHGRQRSSGCLSERHLHARAN